MRPSNFGHITSTTTLRDNEILDIQKTYCNLQISCLFSLSALALLNCYFTLWWHCAGNRGAALLDQIWHPPSPVSSPCLCPQKSYFMHILPQKKKKRILKDTVPIGDLGQPTSSPALSSTHRMFRKITVQEISQLADSWKVLRTTCGFQELGDERKKAALCVT